MTRTLPIALGLLAAVPAHAFEDLAFDTPALVGAHLAPLEEVELGDLDGDGDLDIVVCGPSGVGWYLQEPTGWTWTPGPTAACDALELGDLDRDTQLDVATLEPGVGLVVHYLDSVTTWSSYVVDTAFTWDQGIADFAIADANRDGWLDFLTHTTGGAPLEQLNLGGRDAGFAWTVSGYSIGPGTQVQAGDFDHDGRQELGVLDGTTGSFIMDWGDSNNADDFGVLRNTLAADFVIVDLDQNGVADVLYWASPAEDGGIRSMESGDTRAVDWGPGTAVSIGEFDHDGRLEIVSVHDGMLRVTHEELIPGDWDFFQDLVPFVPTGAVHSVAGDLDGDGDLDLVLYDAAGVHRVVNRTPNVLTAPGNLYAIDGSWTAPSLVLTGQLDHVFVEDLVVAGRNGDGLTALLTPAFDGFPPTFIPHTITTRTVGSVGVLVDLDFDGALDVVATDEAGNLYGWESRNGGTNWLERDLGRADVTALAVGDVDRDGDSDLIVGTGDNKVAWIERDRNWGTGTLHEVFVGTGPITALDVGDLDNDGDLDLIALEEGVGQAVVHGFRNPGVGGSWPAVVLHTSTTIPTRVALLDADNDAQLDLLVDVDGTLRLTSPGVDPFTGAWTLLSSTTTGSQLTSAPIDVDGDGVSEVLTWDGTHVWAHGYDWRTGTWEAPALAREEVVDAPLSMTAFLRAPWDGVLDPVIAHGGTTPGVTWNLGTVRDSITGTYLPLPDDGAHISYLDAWTVGIPTLTYAAKPGDTPVVPARIRMQGSLDGSPASGATLEGLGTWTVWFDADGDSLLDRAADLPIPVTPTPDGSALDLRIDRSAGMPSVEPQSTGTWFVELQPGLEVSTQPARALDLHVSSVRTDTLYSRVRMDADWSGTVTGNWIIGNTEPLFPELRVPVDEGAEVLFDPLDAATDADGDPLVLVGPIGQPLHGQVAVEGGLIRFSHDGSEQPEDILLVEVSDGLETAPRVVVFDVIPSDDSPWATDSSIEGLEDVPLEISLLGGDPDDVPVFEVTVPPTHGQAVLTDLGDGPVVTYTPDANYVGPDSFTFVVRGGTLVSLPATISLTLLENDADDDDGDGLVDALDLCPDDASPENTDTDGDGEGDACDDDDDNDGLADGLDPCPFLPAPQSPGVDDPCFDDDDGDGVLDVDDACPFDADPTQADLDGDGLGDACDDDDDGDLVPDEEDNCLEASNLAQLDADGDGLGDACDADDDDDGVTDVDDLCPWVADPDQQDADADGVGDACDGDADNDGTPGELDCDDLDPAVQETMAFYDDIDGDGFGDGASLIEACASSPPAGTSWDGTDNCPDDANPDQSDLDADGIGDACDPTPGLPSEEPRPGDEDDLDDSDCGCHQSGGVGPWALIPLVLVLRRRTRRCRGRNNA